MQKTMHYMEKRKQENRNEQLQINLRGRRGITAHKAFGPKVI